MEKETDKEKDERRPSAAGDDGGVEKKEEEEEEKVSARQMLFRAGQTVLADTLAMEGQGGIGGLEDVQQQDEQQESQSQGKEDENTVIDFADHWIQSNELNYQNKKKAGRGDPNMFSLSSMVAVAEGDRSTHLDLDRKQQEGGGHGGDDKKDDDDEYSEYVGNEDDDDDDLSSVFSDSCSSMDSAEAREAAIRDGFLAFLYNYLGCALFAKFVGPILTQGEKLVCQLFKKLKGGGEDDEGGLGDELGEELANEAMQMTGDAVLNPMAQGGGGGFGGGAGGAAPVPTGAPVGPPPGVAEMAGMSV